MVEGCGLEMMPLFCAGFIVRWLPRLKGQLQGPLFDDEEYWDVSGRDCGCINTRGSQISQLPTARFLHLRFLSYTVDNCWKVPRFPNRQVPDFPQ